MREQLLKSYTKLYQTENKIQRKSTIEWSRDVSMGKTHKKFSENGEFQTVYLARDPKLPRLLIEKYQGYRNNLQTKRKIQEDNSLLNFILSFTRLI